MRLLHLGDLEYSLPLAAAVLAWLLAARAWRPAAAWMLLYGGALGLVGASKIAYLGWGADISALGFKAISGHATGVTAVYPLAAYLLCRAAGRGPGLTAGGAGLVLGAVVALELVLHGEHTVAEAATGWLLGAGASIGTLYRLEQPAGALGGRSLAGAGNSRTLGSSGRLGSPAGVETAGSHGRVEGVSKPAGSVGSTESAIGPGSDASRGCVGSVGGLDSIGRFRSPERPENLEAVASCGRLGSGGNLGSGGSLESVERSGGAGYIPSACCAVLVFAASAALMQSAHVEYWMIKVALALSGNARPFPWDGGG